MTRTMILTGSSNLDTSNLTVSRHFKVLACFFRTIHKTTTSRECREKFTTSEKRLLNHIRRAGLAVDMRCQLGSARGHAQELNRMTRKL